MRLGPAVLSVVLASGLSQSNYYYEGGVFFVCPFLLNLFRYPSNNVRI